MEEGTEAALEAPAADDATGALFAMARAQLVAGAGSAPGSLFLAFAPTRRWQFARLASVFGRRRSRAPSAGTQPR